MKTLSSMHRRVLVIDDNVAIHDDFRKILCPQGQPSDQLRSAADKLFGRETAPQRNVQYAIDAAARGQDGVALLEQSQRDGEPYLLAFVDVRMPNGWNGIETVQHLWNTAPGLQVVLCTAFSDFSWDEIRTELPQSDRFVILKKPFDAIEVQQLAETLTERNLAEMALVESERALQEAQQVALIGNFVYSARSGRWTESQALRDLFGVDDSFASDFEQWLGLVDAPYRDALRQSMDKASHNTRGFEQVCRITRWSDGQTRWMAARGFWERDAEGLPSRLLGTFQDITRNQASQEHLRMLEACVARINDAVVITDAGGKDGVHRIVFVNDAFVRRTGYSMADVLGKSPKLLQGPKTERSTLDLIAAALANWHPIRTELLNYTRDGQEFWVELDLVPIENEAGRCTHWAAVQRDISYQKEASANIQYLAYYDSLTTLPNRRLLFDRLQQTLSACARQPTYCGLLFIDLDNFKSLNDTHGHDQGDELLVQVSQRLQDCVRDEDTVARFGGDEFVIILRSLGASPEQATSHAETVCKKITERLASSYLLSETEFRTTASVGITLFGHVPARADDVLKQADLAMYQAKAAGKNQFAFFDANQQVMADERSKLANEIRLAMDRGELSLHYQPQFHSERGLTGVEALLRWKSPQRGYVPPAEFIPVAEQAGLMPQLGDWVMEEACRELVRWAALPSTAHLSMSVNVSSLQFQADDFVERVLSCLLRTSAPAEKLKLELTESLLVNDLAMVNLKMTRLKTHGIRLSLDDFGTGYSSLSYLKNLPLDQLKIDQSFVRDVMVDVDDANIAKTIIALCTALELEAVAEGVETVAQKEFLMSIGCNAFQGYLFSRPLPAPELLQFAGSFRYSDDLPGIIHNRTAANPP